MIWEELLAKAEAHAQKAGLPPDRLHEPKLRETALITFRSKSSKAAAKFHLDATTGDLISTAFSTPELPPKRPGKQLSKRAQRLLALANEESRQLGCDQVGSEHLLLAVLTHAKDRGAAVLLRAGLTAEAVRQRIATIGATMEVATDGYGPSLRNVLRIACQHAHTLSDAEIEPEHLVLALMDKVNGPAMSLLRHFDVDIRRAKIALLQRMSDQSD